MTDRPSGTAYLLSQLGILSASRFGALLEPLGLTPPQAGVLRLLAREGGISQRALAARLGTAPSRVVVLVDALEAKGLVTRQRSETDRRNHELHLTPAGTAMMRRLGRVAGAHEADVLEGLTAAERSALRGLLGKLADAHDLDPQVHPGYRARP
ncbi:MAG: MarR family transcriptional regulator [Nocardioidaceae bacterium]|nr:MarR family transcriptional regulator [Nocardioidaceae bacterium]MCL2612957.1 MarR family transcriptional regulator [Nocardioidaceae bacterium]